MKLKPFYAIIPILFAVAVLSGCQAGRANFGVASNTGNVPALSTVMASPTPQATPTQAPTATEAAASPTQQPTLSQEDEAVTVAQAYFAAVSAGNSEAAANLLSTFSLAVFQMTRGDATEALQAQKIDGIRWSDLEVISAEPFDDQTVLVHVTYSVTGKATPTPTAAAQATPEATQTAGAGLVDALWPMRLERGEWRYNWNNLIDFRTPDAEAQTVNGITILPLQLTRYSDRIELSMLIQNRTNKVVVFGQVNETLGTFYFGDQQVVAEKAQWILNPLRAVPSVTLEIKGLFTELPDKVEIRKWNNYDVPPWFVFQLR